MTQALAALSAHDRAGVATDRPRSLILVVDHTFHAPTKLIDLKRLDHACLPGLRWLQKVR
jgi:hypothetical protein